MRLSYTVFMRAYSFFSILFFVFGALAIVVGGPALIVSYAWKEPSIQSAVSVFRVIVIVVFGAGFVISSLTIIVTRRRGFVAYKRIIDRLSNTRSTQFNLNVTFPEQDEFGDLGKWLNRFISQLKDFDRIKVERLRAAQQKVAFLSESIDRGLVIINTEDKINYANSLFVKQFNIGDKTVLGLPLNKVIENEEIENSLQEIHEKPKNQELDEIRVKAGTVTYKTKVTIVPIISSDVALMETMIIFDHIQKKVLRI